MDKKRVLVSYDKLSPEILTALNSKYPGGYANHLQRIESPNPFYYLLLELKEAVYMIKMNIKDVFTSADDDETSDVPVESDETVDRDDSFDFPEED